MAADSLLGLSIALEQIQELKRHLKDCGVYIHIYTYLVMGRSVTLGIGSLFQAFVVCIALIAGPSAATSRSLTQRHYDRPKTHHLYWTVESMNVTKNNETVAVPTVNGMLPGPTVHVNEGDTVVIKVTSKVESDVTMHW